MIGSVNALDATLAVVMGYFLIRGLFQGVIRETFSVIALVAAFFLAGQYWAIGAEHLKTITPNAAHRSIISFFLTYMAVYFLISLAGIFVEKLLRLPLSAVTSSILGGVIGLLKGAALVALTLLCATAFIGRNADFFTKSKAWPQAELLSEAVKRVMPNDLKILLEVKVPALADGLAGPRTGPSAQPAPLKLDPDDIDWSRIREILGEDPASIQPTWQARFENIESEAELSDAEVRQFIKDHPGLFASPKAGAAAPEAAQPQPNPPSWPQPAGS